MIKVSKKDTWALKNSELCIADIYEIGDKDIDISVAKINGRYPEKGYCVNTMVKEMIYVIMGEGVLITPTAKTKFKAGDAILIDKGEKYYWDAKCKVAMCCTPAWWPDQHLLVD